MLDPITNSVKGDVNIFRPILYPITSNNFDCWLVVFIYNQNTRILTNILKLI